jgi:(p)ppGpp synthase/HD superfamily hydrolase
VFTPKGDVVDLPEDSSPIDFAYAIHSDIGNAISAVKIHGKMSTIGTKLKNGDIVEIVTNKTAHPTSKWLDYTKTSLARKHIQSYVKEHSLLSKFLSFGIKK